ncbi:hypothetical protein NDU88_006971 [Pleurodeles waltl]|uniref:Uncharacterized protein n=1 Tax=Pleurodeles waltl TaxID=8319 RepID=A0AAV7NTI5_PLEWA|nr:hypothetical protein NDU88_006971 [Pleurodeles waltl]
MTLPSKGGHQGHQSFPAGGALRPPSARNRPRGCPASRPRGPVPQGTAAVPRPSEGRPSIVKEEEGVPAARLHRRYGPPAHLSERCPLGPPGSPREAQPSPVQRGGREHAAPRGGRFNLLRRTAISPLQWGEAADIRRSPPSHRSASSALAFEFYKLGPRRNRASRSAGHLAAG